MLQLPPSACPGVFPETNSLWPPCTMCFFSRVYACCSPCQWQRTRMKRAPSGRVVSSNMRRMIAWSSPSSTEIKEMKKLSTRQGSHPECRKWIRTCRLPEHGVGGVLCHRCSTNYMATSAARSVHFLTVLRIICCLHSPVAPCSLLKKILLAMSGFLLMCAVYGPGQSAQDWFHGLSTDYFALP